MLRLNSSSMISSPFQWRLSNKTAPKYGLNFSPKHYKLTSTSTLLSIPENGPFSESRLVDLRWLEKWDQSSILLQNVDLANSQSAVNIPMVDVPVSPSLHISLSFSYTGSDVSTNGPLGNGWTLHNIQEYIVLDHKQSMFPENHEFQLFVDGQQSTLKQVANTTNEFYIEGEDDLSINYQPTTQRWIVETPFLKSVYGRTEGGSPNSEAHQWSLSWRNWRGPGRREMGLTREILAWYLVSREEKQGSQRKLYYRYHIEEKTTSAGNSYTSVIFLENITDADGHFSLSLNYSPKLQTEYFEKYVVNVDGNIQFPIPLALKHYLAGFVLVTNSFQQTFEFHYSTQDKIRTLSSIRQVYTLELNSPEETLFEFKYGSNGGKYFMTEVSIPAYESTINYEYTRLEIPLLKFGKESLNTLRYPAVENIQIKQGEDFGAMAYNIGTGGIFLRLFNKQLTRYKKNMYTCPEGVLQDPIDAYILSEDPLEIEMFALLLYTDLIVVLEDAKEEKRLNLFHRKNTTMEFPDCPDETILMPKHSMFRYSDKIMVVAWNKKDVPGKLTIVRPIANADADEANEKGYELTDIPLSYNENRNITRMVVHDSRILTYDETILTGFKKLQDDTWKEFPIKSITSDQKAIFNKFVLETEMKDSLTDQITLNGLHVVDNMILLSTLEHTYTGHRLFTNANMYLVDQDFRIQQEQVQIASQQNLASLRETQELDDGTVFTFFYNVTRSGIYEGYLLDIRGEMYEEGCKDFEGDDKETCRLQLIEGVQKQNAENFAKMVLFDPEPFMTFQLEQYGAKTKDKMLFMLGDSWEWGNLPNITNMKLSTGYVLQTQQQPESDQTNYALYRQNPSTAGPVGSAMERFILDGNGNIALGFPSYLGVQTDMRQQAQLTVFREAGEETEKIPLGDRGEQILRMSNHEILVSIINSTDPSLAPFDKEIVVRRVNSVVPSTPMWAISKTEVRYKNESRIRSFVNTFSHNDTTVAQANGIRVIPTGNSSVSGWYEEYSIIPIEEPRNATKSQNWYDAGGNLVLSKEVKAAAQEVDDEKEKDEANERNYKIWDISGQLEIADISPYNLTENMVAYFGFEVYERNIFKFDYPVLGILKDEFPFTGERLLRLLPNHNITGSITPDHQKSSFIISTWVRPQGDVALYRYDDPVQYFKSYIKTHTGVDIVGLHGQMKRQMENWLYLEIAVDLDRIRNNVYAEMYRMTAVKDQLPVPLHTNFTIQIEFDSTGYDFIDIDHIRFAPAQLDFTVSVFNSRTAVETEMIESNGGILRKIYDHSGVEVASVDVDGNIEQFKAATRSTATFPTPKAEERPPLQQLRKEVIIIPENGRFDSFDKYSMSQRWTYSGGDSSWIISKASVLHKATEAHRLSAKSAELMFDPSSSAVRFYIKRLSADAKLTISLYGYDNLVQINDDNTLDIGYDCRHISDLPSNGELLLFVEHQAIWVWFNGVLVADRKLSRGCIPPQSFPNDTPWSHFEITATGLLEISQLITLSNPQITIEYQNAWGDRTQVLQLEKHDTVLVTETIYDELGRDAIKTKTSRIQRSEDSSGLLGYIEDYVSNRNPEAENSIFKTGVASGLISELNPLDEGYPYSRSIYYDDMLREVKTEGMPGKAYSIAGSFTKQHGRHSGIIFLKILFPPENGFREKVVYEPSGNIKVTVLDKNENEVAEYVKVAGYDNILSISEYDKDGNILKIIPPLYHQKMNTFMNRTIPWNFGDDMLAPEEKYWQDRLASHFRYDDKGQLIFKKTPDLKSKGYIYDVMGNVRFMYNLKSSNESAGLVDDLAYDIIYLVNIGRSKPTEIGYIKDTIPVAELKSQENSTSVVGHSYLHQKVAYSTTHSDPELRGKLKLFLTYDDYSEDPTMSGVQPPHQEVLKFNLANHVVMKTSNAVHSGSFTSFQKHYQGGKLRELQHPPEDIGDGENPRGLNVIYSYDKMGRLTSLGTRGNPQEYVQFTYNAAGQIETETMEPESEQEILRHYEYDSPGLLNKIQDPYLSQTVSFIDGGYGQAGYGDGIITQNVFNSSWSAISNLDNIQKEWFRLPVEDFEGDKAMNMCFSAMQRLGYLDKDTLIPTRFLTNSLLSNLPVPCTGSLGLKLMKLVAKYFPMSSNYGHKYAYGSHRELVKAKFFGDAEPESLDSPLQVKSFFTEIEEVDDLLVAQDIFEKLVAASFLIVDNGNPDDIHSAIGKQGQTQIFRYDQLLRDIAGVDQTAATFTIEVMKLLYDRLANSESPITLDEFQYSYVEWHGYWDMETPLIIINRAKEVAEKVYQMLSSKGYIQAELVSLLDARYVTTLAPYGEILHKITAVILAHFKSQIGLNVFDYESYYIDPNGNHGTYYVGFNRHRLEYVNDTNQVGTLSVQDPFGLPGEDEKISQMEHDSQGNVSKAPHRGIEKIKYHPVVNRPTFIELTDGRRITIKYDAQGERLLKRVFSPELKLMSEVKYLRDEHGAVLMDKRVTFDENGKKDKEVTSTYLYGPRKTILGFVRNGKFYSVFTDHAGSIRLILHKGRVVAGYDYWPYGDLMKQFGDEDAHLMYRFTGQEYDPETGLYNYHARIYDPTIGRFFQPDPKSQYFSPYVYGGNSPISLVDPDGEFFFTLFCIITAIIGAYLATAAANGSWNPAKWDWKSGKTWLALIGGGIGGYMLPGAFVAAAASIGVVPAILVGVAGSYLQGALQNGNWNPGDWDWTSPATYNAFLEGFSSGLSAGTDLVDSVKNLHKFAKSFSKLGQVMVYSGAILGGVGMAYLKGALANGKNFKFWEWDFKNPETMSAIFDGFQSGIGLPEKGHDMFKNYAKLGKDGNFKKMLTDMKGSAKSFFKTSLKDKNHPLYKVMGKAVVAYLMVSMDNESFDLTKWDWKSRSTYEGILNGWKAGPDILDMHNKYIGGIANVKDKLHAFGGEKKQQEDLLSFTEELLESMNDLLDFYFDFPFPFGGSKRRRRNMIPIAAKMFANLVNGLRRANRNVDHIPNIADDDFQQLLKQMLSGLKAGSYITPTMESGLDKLVDCISLTGSSNTTEVFQLCNIANPNSITGLQNREHVHQLFVPTNLYQSKIEFLPVPVSQDPKEFIEHVANMIHLEVPLNMLDEGFTSSMFVGSIYNSLLNTPNEGPASSQLFFRSFEIPTLQINVLHIAKLSSDEEGNNALKIRSILTIPAGRFSSIRSDLVREITQLKYDCYLPNQLIPTVTEISAETIVITTAADKAEVFILTPDYSTSPDNCSSYPQKLYEVPVPTRNIFEEFKGMQNGTATVSAKLQDYEEFLNAVVSDYNEMANLPSSVFNAACRGCLAGYTYGLLSLNMKQTFGLSLHLSSTVDSDELLFAGKRDSQGFPTFQGTPSIIYIGDGEYLVESSLRFKAAMISLDKKGLIGSISSHQLVQVDQQTLPNYDGIYNLLFTSNESKFTQLVRYLYHSHHLSGSVHPRDNNENSHFISNFVLGEFLSRMEDENIEIFSFLPHGSGSQERLAAQRGFFLRNKENNYCTFLNIIESSKYSNGKYEFDPNVRTDIPSIPDVEIKYLRHYKLLVNINSMSGWSMEDAEPGASQSHVFLQQVYVGAEDIRNIPRDNSSYLQLNSPFRNSNGNNNINFSKDYITNLFQLLKENRLHQLINSDQDFRSVAMGLLAGFTAQVQPDVDGISVALQKFITWRDTISQPPLALSLLSLNSDGVVIPQTNQVLLANLKTSEIGTEEDILQKMDVAKKELKEYYCSREDNVKEVFRLTNLPGVYNSNESHTPEMGDRVTFEVDPLMLTGINCTASENPFKKYLRKENKNEKENTRGFFGGFFDSIKQFSERFYAKNEKPASVIPEDVHVDGCHLGAWMDGQYSTDGITCSSGKSKIVVFRNIGQNDMVTVTSRGKPFSLVGDTYKKGSCSPITFNGKPSVVCDGDKTTLIYTPTFEKKLFDELDGNIMLGRVALHLGGKLWKFVRQTGFDKFSSRAKGLHMVTDEMIAEWNGDILKVHEILGKWEGPKEDIQWALRQLDECRGIVQGIKLDEFNVAPEVIEDITERLMALQEDIAEQVLYFKAENVYGEEQKANEDRGTQGTRFSFGNMYSGVQTGMGGNNSFTGLNNNISR